VHFECSRANSLTHSLALSPFSTQSTTQQCKTLESALQTYNAAGKKVSQSYRCADMDREVPELMGVSKAIVENVIFCHQEDSNWPLADSSTLKKKFDDIFAATRYTKALETIKKFRKDQAQEVKELKLKLETIAVHRQQAHKCADDEQRLQRRLDKLKAEREAALARAQVAKQEHEALRQAAESHKEALARIGEARARLAELEARVAELRRALGEQAACDLTDAQLRAALQQFDASVADAESKQAPIDKKIAENEALRPRHQKKRDGLAVEYGRLLSLAADLKKLCDQRDASVLKLAQQYRLAAESFAAPLSDDAVRAFFHQVDGKLQQLKDQGDNETAAFKARSSELADAANRASAELQAAERERAVADDRVSEAERQIAALEDELQVARALVASAGDARKQLDSARRDAAALRKAFDVDAGRAQLADVVRQRQTAEAAMRERSATLRQLSTQAGAVKQLELLHRQADEKRSQLAALADASGVTRARTAIGTMRMHGESGELLDVDAQLAQVGDALAQRRALTPAQAKALRTAQSASAKRRLLAKTAAADARHGQSAAAGERLAAERRIEELELEIERKQRTLRDELREHGDGSFASLLDVARRSVDDAGEALANVSATRRVFKHIQQDAESGSACPTCLRAFSGAADRVALLNNVRRLLAETSAAQAQTEFEARQQVLSQLVALQPHAETVTRLREEELPRAKASLAALLQRATSSSAEVERLETIEREITTLDECLLRLCNSASEFAALLAALAETERLSADVVAQMGSNAAAASSGVSIEQLEQEVAARAADVTRLVAEEAQLSKAIDANGERLRKADARVASLHADIGKTDVAHASLERLDAELEARRAAVLERRAAAQAAEHALPALRDAAAKAQSARDAAGRAHRETLEQLSSEREMFRSRTGQARTLQEQATEKVAALSAGAKISDIKHAKEAADNDIAELEAAHRRCLSEREAARQLIANAQIERRRLQDTMVLRKALADKHDLAARIDELTGALPEAARLSAASVESLKSSADKLSAAVAQGERLYGEIKSVEQQHRDLRGELQREQFQDIDKRFGELQVQVTVTDVANADLDRYYKALDNALIRFHTAKMAEINKIIRELWQATYTGQDIDTIEIRSENGASTGADSRRQYDYRVVMVKGGIALDMRGRCSAGQKVLAAIVIRLALAETFCLNCGILALDEPTTNLDRANVESLANALVTIIQTRAKQSNFQLIIITHDEEFVELLGRSEYADFYWRVSKSPAGFSTVERRDIANL
jgi:DNA repair protein RAD50